MAPDIRVFVMEHPEERINNRLPPQSSECIHYPHPDRPVPIAERKDKPVDGPLVADLPESPGSPESYYTLAVTENPDQGLDCGFPDPGKGKGGGPPDILIIIPEIRNEIPDPCCKIVHDSPNTHPKR